MNMNNMTGFSPIFRYEPEHHERGGITYGALREMIWQMQSDGAEPEMIDTVTEIAEQDDDSREFFDAQRARGTYVFAAEGNSSRFNHASSLDAVVLAKGEDRIFASDCFSLVRMAVWMRAGWYDRPTFSKQQAIIDDCLVSLESVPIVDWTIIAPLGTTEFEPYVFGYRRDTNAISRLTLSRSLTEKLLATTGEHYEDQLNMLLAFNEHRNIESDL